MPVNFREFVLAAREGLSADVFATAERAADRVVPEEQIHHVANRMLQSEGVNFNDKHGYRELGLDDYDNLAMSGIHRSMRRMQPAYPIYSRESDIAPVPTTAYVTTPIFTKTVKRITAANKRDGVKHTNVVAKRIIGGKNTKRKRKGRSVL